MTDTFQLLKKLEQLGLSEKQARLYLLLLQKGNLRINEIVRAVSLPRSTVYEVIKDLTRAGLVEEIQENSFKVISAYPVSILKHKNDEKVLALQKQSAEIQLLEKTLEVLPALPASSPIIIRYYKDQSGARQLFWNSLKAKGTTYVQSEWGRGRYVGISFYKRFVTESYARNIQEKVITNSNKRVLSSIRQHTDTPVSRANIASIRCVTAEKLTFKGETLIYDNIYAHINLKGEQISGFEIESQQFVETQRSIFETLWDTATPVSQLL